MRLVDTLNHGYRILVFGHVTADWTPQVSAGFSYSWLLSSITLVRYLKHSWLEHKSLLHESHKRYLIHLWLIWMSDQYWCIVYQKLLDFISYYLIPTLYYLDAIALFYQVICNGTKLSDFANLQSVIFGYSSSNKNFRCFAREMAEQTSWLFI